MTIGGTPNRDRARVIASRAAATMTSLAHRARREPFALERLSAVQDGHHLDLRMVPAAGIIARSVWGHCVETDQWTHLADVRPGTAGCDVRLDLLAIPRAHDVDSATVLYLEVETGDDARLGARNRQPLGTAKHTEVGSLNEIVDEHSRLTPYLDSHGCLSVWVDRAVRPFGGVDVSRLVVRRGVVRMKGRLHSRHGDVSGADFLLKGRTSGARIVRPIPLESSKERPADQFGLRSYSYDVGVDCTAFLDDPNPADDVYDAWFRVRTTQHPEGYEIRVGRTRFLARFRTRPGWAHQGRRTVAVGPYYTFKAKRTSFKVSFFDGGDFAYLRRQMRLRWLTRALDWNRDVWLVGERPDTAQDNGYWFFRYLRERHPEIEAYYVIASSSPDRANVEMLGNVLDFGSREHIKLTLLARKVVSSHHPEMLFPVRTDEFSHTVRATRVFLQHGVMGTKWMSSLYGRSAPGFEADVFVVSSQREREYIIKDFGYRPDQVAVTGLPRFDSLFAGDVDRKPRQLLIMPTWRDWLQDADLYPESEYHQTWFALLHDPGFRSLVEEHDLEVIFCLHANMRQHRELFDDVPARVITHDHVDVQRLLKQSALLITDYSSVGFDFSFLHKPVIYFQFDREQFLGPQGSHLDLDEELPGPILRSPNSVLAELRTRAASGFAVDIEYVRRADRFLAHHDRGSSSRVYDVVRNSRRRRGRWERVANHEIASIVPRYLRRHRLYFPAMRRAFKLWKLLPADPNLVLFESASGKQYADGPRYLYEELVRRWPEMKKVWAYTGKLPTADPNTRVVQRLSPSYYYYLARARFWVNNQSFPHYIRRRRDGVFVQTWHGTPLKRMGHDVREVHGRDTGYIARATAGAAQWTVLVSPNAFATEAIRSAYLYRGDVLEVGYPRNDLLHRDDRDELAARIRASLGIRAEQRVVLYAPTFRDDQLRPGRYEVELPFDLVRMHRELGEQTVLLLRLHALVEGRIDIPPPLRDHIRDVSPYSEVQELLLIADVLVTDYSSLFFDYASLRRPMVFYAYDLDAYRDKLRGFYLDYEKVVPGPIVETEDQLIHTLADLSDLEIDSRAVRDEFLARYCARDDGHAAERVVESVFGSQRRPSIEVGAHTVRSSAFRSIMLRLRSVLAR